MELLAIYMQEFEIVGYQGVKFKPCLYTTYKSVCVYALKYNIFHCNTWEPVWSVRLQPNCVTRGMSQDTIESNESSTTIQITAFDPRDAARWL